MIEHALAILLGAATWRLGVYLVQRARGRRYVLELIAAPSPEHVPGVCSVAGREVPELVHALTDTLAAYAREHPELDAARVTIEVSR